MTEQGRLFPERDKPERGRARRSDPPTSHKAARSIDARRGDVQLLAALRDSKDGLTTHELEKILGRQLVSISPRMKPLEKKGQVRRSGRTRKGDSGHDSIVWEIVK